MSKLYRSMLWSGLLVAGVAACGDDVTVSGPGDPTVRSISVAPNGVTVGNGVTIPFSAAVNADAGVTNLAVTWSTSDPSKATINATTGVVTTAATGSGAVAIIACSVLVPSVCGNATLTISSTAATVTGVTVVPNAPFINRGGTVTLVASVQGTNAPAQTVTWVSANPAAVSVGANTGVVTAAANAPAGTVAITACSTVTGFTNVCGSSAVTVVIPDPAQVFIESVTNTVGGNEVPVVLTNVGGQIQINTEINTGAQQISRVDALIDGVVVASQSFAVQPAAVRVDESGNVVLNVTLSTDTRQLRRNGSLFLPVVFNGNAAITAHLYVVGATLPVASNAIPVVMANVDQAVKVGTALTLTNNLATPSYNDGVNIWFTGSQSVGAVNYISFSGVAPTALPFGSTVCGNTNSTQVTGTPTTGLSIGGTFNCAGVEGGNATTGANFGLISYGGAVGPDGTAITAATGYANVGTAFCVPKAGVATFTNLPPNCDANSDQRWNMIIPGTAPTNPAAVFVDNKAPTVTLKTIAYNVLYDQWWINGSYAFNAANVINTTTEAGTGVASTQVYAQATGAIACGSGTLVATGAALAETITSTAVDGWRICARQVDNIGNVGGLVGFSNYFGVDTGTPSIRFVTTTAPAPVGTISTVSSTANTTIYSMAAPLPAGHIFAIEANDSRSGFHQGAPLLSNQKPPLNSWSHAFLNSAGNFGCPFPPFTLPTVLVDSWVRSVEREINCTPPVATPSYFAWSANVADRAGNVSSTIARNFAKDDLAAADITNLSFAQLLYAPGASAGFNVFGTDDLEVIEGTLMFAYDGNNDNTTEFYVRYPYSLFPLGVRWDGSITNIVSGTPLSIASLIGRFDTTATATNLPSGGYASRQNALPDSVYANLRDVASQPDATPLVVGLNAVTQFSDSTIAPWGSAPAAVFGDANSIWQGSTAGPNKLATQRTGTSVTVPYFDSVNLYGVIGGELVLCGTFGAPTLSDNGVFRTWQYSMTTPAGANACAGAGAWRVGGVKGNAIMLSQQF